MKSFQRSKINQTHYLWRRRILVAANSFSRFLTSIPFSKGWRFPKEQTFMTSHLQLDKWTIMILPDLLLETQTSEFLKTQTKLPTINSYISIQTSLYYTVLSLILHYLFLNLRIYATSTLNHNPVSSHFVQYKQAKPQQLGRENPSYWPPRPVATTISSKYCRRKWQSESRMRGRSEPRVMGTQSTVWSTFLMQNFL